MQFAPQVGDVSNNLNRADAVLSRANPKDIDLLVLPELAFSGYNFKSLQHISPYLEPTTAGITSLWARTTALKYNCIVTAGYPEKVDISFKWPASPEYYNSAITVNRVGETIGNYRKSFLYYTDETWALEGPDGFFGGYIEGLGNVAMGICMDLNPYKFEAPWNAWEFANHILHREANLVILSMAWLTREEARSYSRTPREPDMETLSYWVSRLEPIIRAEGEEEIIVVFANRSGTEDSAVYAGTSAVLGVQEGEVRVYGILGRGERELLVVDTSKRPAAHLISDPSARDKAKAKPIGPDNPGDLSDVRSSMSSGFTVESEDSICTLDSELSISTAPTSANLDTMVSPSIENCCLTPTSPVDAPFPQSYFGSLESPIGVPEPEILPPENFQQTLTPSPKPDVLRRPESPKSRNASRSRGTPQDESPLIGADFVPVPANMSSRTEAWIPKAAKVSEARPSRAAFDINKPIQSASADPSQQDSSFTKNSLGPRSRHVSPRPQSTIW